jgi:hypothetical protein
LLALTTPRRGSSWVGPTLGGAAAAAYRREPLTHDWARRRGRPAVFEPDPTAPPPSYRRDADLAIAGVPRFPGDVVRDPRQWRVTDRGRRVVVKEVNPLAVHWLVETCRPRLLYLTRHPAAVAESTTRQGWQVHGYGELFPPSRRASGELREEEVGEDVYTRLGAVQAHAARRVLDVVDRAASYGIEARVQSFESLCLDPLGEFRALFDFAGLRWDDAVAVDVRARSEGRAVTSDEPVSRRSAELPDLWRHALTIEQAAAVRRGWEMFDPPLYGPETW